MYPDGPERAKLFEEPQTYEAVYQLAKTLHLCDALIAQEGQLKSFSVPPTNVVKPVDDIWSSLEKIAIAALLKMVEKRTDTKKADFTTLADLLIFSSCSPDFESGEFLDLIRENILLSPIDRSFLTGPQRKKIIQAYFMVGL